VKGVKVLAASSRARTSKTLRDTLDQLKGKLKSSAIVLAAAEGEKVSLIAGVTQDLIAKVKAGELVNFVASQVGGKGGGPPGHGAGGGTDSAALPKALASVQGLGRASASSFGSRAPASPTYLRSAGLESLGGRVADVERALRATSRWHAIEREGPRSSIPARSTNLPRVPMPHHADGACSVVDDLAPVPYDLTRHSRRAQRCRRRGAWALLAAPRRARDGKPPALNGSEIYQRRQVPLSACRMLVEGRVMFAAPAAPKYPAHARVRRAAVTNATRSGSPAAPRVIDDVCEARRGGRRLLRLPSRACRSEAWRADFLGRRAQRGRHRRRRGEAQGLLRRRAPRRGSPRSRSSAPAVLP
jgi:hypothetical protein